MLLGFYCLSFSPTFIFHDHDHAHNDNELSDCESVAETLDNHFTCSHKEHLMNVKEKCFLCSYCTICDDSALTQIIKSENNFNIEKASQLCERWYLQDFASYPNKSPPLVI